MGVLRLSRAGIANSKKYNDLLTDTIGGGMNWQIFTGLPNAFHSASAYAPLANGSWFVFRTGTNNIGTSTNAYVSSTDGINWTNRTLPVSQNWTVAVSNGSRILLFADGTVNPYYTDDGTTWTAGSTTFRAGGAIWDGTQFIATVASTGSTLRYSTNGASWSSINISAFGNTPSAIGYGDGRYIVTGGGSGVDVIHTCTTDPRLAANWSNVTMPSGGASRQSITFGNGIWIINRPDSTTYEYSTNGTTWTVGTLPIAPSFPATNGQKMMCFSQNQFSYIALSDGFRNIVSSTDGINWQVAPISADTDKFVLSGYATDGTRAIMTGYRIVGTTDTVTGRYGWGQ